MAEWPGIYKTGLATVAANGTTVTFQNAGNIAQAVRPGDRFGAHVGLGIRIAAMVGNVATLAQPWPGPAQTTAAYEIALTPYDSGYRQQLQVLLDRYGGAALGVAWNNEDWASGEIYLIDTGLEHLGSTYRAISEHTASAANEPGVGANWQQVWRILAQRGDFSPEDRAYLDETKATATGAASAAIDAAEDADADRIATAADRVQTGQDRAQTGQDRAAIAGAFEATAADRIATGQDRAKTTADAAATAADRVQTGQDRTQTGQDRVSTAADRVQTGQDKAATAADRVQTGQDRNAIAGAQDATAADRAQTALDRIATGQDRTATNTASSAAVNAAQAASEDATATAADRVQTGLDRTQTGQDRTVTGQDKAATAADRIQTGQDRAAIAGATEATAADRVQTGLDRAAAAASAQQAADTAAAVNPDAVNARFTAVEGEVDALEGLVGGKADQPALAAHTGATNNPHGVTKAQVGLGNADNTSDANKPVSSAQATALALKAPLAGPVLTGVPRAPTPTAGTNTDQIATAAFVQSMVNGLIAGAPGLLDTFDEIAAAMGDDPNFATTILNALAGKQPLDSDLTAIATLTTQAFGRSVLTAADAAALRTMAELVVGTHVQGYDADLAAIASLATTPFGRGLLTIADQAGLLATAGALAVSAQATVAQIIAGAADDVYMTPADFAGALQAVTFVPSAINLAALVNGKVTLTGNVTFAAPTNAKEQTGYFYITQDGTGGRAASWNTFWDFGADGPPTLSTGANKTDLVTYTVLPGATKALCSFKAAS